MDGRREVPSPPMQRSPQDDCGREVGNLLEGPEHVRRPLGVEVVRHETIPDQRQGGDDRDDEEGVVAGVTTGDPLRGQEDEQRRERDEREPQIREGPMTETEAYGVTKAQPPMKNEAGAQARS